LCIHLEAKIGRILEVQGVTNYCEKSEGANGESLESDNGDEYTSTKFKAYLAGKGIEY